jgi:transcriptional regulator with XRE-family HTH domain
VGRRSVRGFQPNVLRDRRLERGFTQAELARILGLTPGAVKAWEAGRGTPKIETLVKLVDPSVLDIDISALVSVPKGETFLGDLRTLRLITQSQLAERIGLSQTMMGALERGEINLSEDVAEMLAAELDYSLSDIRSAFNRARSRPPHTPV